MTSSTTSDAEFYKADEEFLHELLVSAGFDPEEDDFDLLMEDLAPILAERIILKLYAALPTEKDRAEMDAMFAAGEETDPDALRAFLMERIPNFDDFMYQVYTEFWDDYLKSMEALDEIGEDELDVVDAD